MEENKTDVTPESSTGTGSQPATVVAEPVGEPQPQKPPAGFVPYQALNEERDKRKELERELEILKKTPTPSEDEDLYSDEGKKLKGEISTLGDKLRDVERRESRREAETEFPVLKDKKEEFDAFLEDEENKRLSIKKAAKLFLAEKNLLVQETPERKGLEAPTGGGQKPPEGKPTDEEIENIRKTDFRKYEKLIRERKI